MSTTEDEIILEPGDPGYVDPNAPPPPEPAEAPAGKDLTPPRLPGESDGDYVLRTKNLVVQSESPTDIVPNQPQITMSTEPPPVPEAEPEAEAEEDEA